ncbi:hypothetical protein FRC03_012830 [Tulasnella sp. 419]|nr:hypothetical protein FRC03_012830 [Tulasnella sp. 419]
MPTQPAAKDAEEKYERDLRDWKCTKNSPTTSSSTPPKFTFEVIEKIILNEDARDAEYNTGNSGQAMVTQKNALTSMLVAVTVEIGGAAST